VTITTTAVLPTTVSMVTLSPSTTLPLMTALPTALQMSTELPKTTAGSILPMVLPDPVRSTPSGMSQRRISVSVMIFPWTGFHPGQKKKILKFN
jgi:hypothetical protein